MKLLILGHGRHGKDTVAEMLRDMIGLAFRSSSEAAAEIAVFPALRELYGYETPQQCFDDRHNHRTEWMLLITAYNTPDKARLCREVLETSDCYVGMRCPLEYAAVRGMFDAVVWVDASERVPDDSTMKIPHEETMITIRNNGTVERLRESVGALAEYLVELKQ